MKKMFKCRASALSQIMTNPRSKSAVLSETAKTYCEQWLIENTFGRKKDIFSKYMEKGTLMEDEGLAFLTTNLPDVPMLLKNEKYFEDDFFTGTPDIVLPEKIIDLKCSWDIFSFPHFEEALDKAYWWQMQCYMALTGKQQAEVIYVLIDTPTHILEREWHNKCNNGHLTEYEKEDLYSEILTSGVFDDIHPEERIKRFLVKYDANAINEAEARIKQCREYILELRLNL